MPLVVRVIAITFVLILQNALDLNVKWPNDIYANSSVKIGGLIVNSLIQGSEAICNVGRFIFLM